MHAIVSLPYDGGDGKDAVLGNVRKGLGQMGKECDMIDLPALSVDTIDNLFEAEEKIKGVEPLVQDTIRRFIEEYRRIEAKEMSERAVLGKMFDHYIKTFKWDGVTYNRKGKISEIIQMMEEEVSLIQNYYAEKIKTYNEQKKQKDAVDKKVHGSVYDLDISRLVYAGHEGEEPVKTTLVKRYYIVVPGELGGAMLEKLSEVPGLFIEARTPIYRSGEGEIFEVVGKAGLEEELANQLGQEGIRLRTPCSTAEEYKASLEADKKVLDRYEDLRHSMVSFISMHLTVLFKILLHAKVLSLYIESILRFGLPASFCFFVSRIDRDRAKVFSHWSRVSKHWKYSARVVRVNKMVNEDTEFLPLYDFVYCLIRNFSMEPIDAD